MKPSRHEGAMEGETNPYPANQQRIVKLLGPSWCFAHQEPEPCRLCAAMPKFIGMCFDCRAEFATELEIEAGGATNCSCGGKIRGKRLYLYP